MSLRIAIVQMNSWVGDFARNAETIFDYAQRAAQQGADIVLTPELSLAGYPPEDLLQRPAFYTECAQQLAQLVRRLEDELQHFPELHLVVGYPLLENGQHYNAVSVIHQGKITYTYRKHDLPNYLVFDEKRYFSAADEACVFEVKGIKCGINICEDTWFAHAPSRARAAGAQILLVPNGSPYHQQKNVLRYQVVRDQVCAQGMSVVYANLVGGQDELVFDGNSFVLNAQGQIAAQLKHCVEDFEMISFDEHAQPQATRQEVALSLEAEIYQALVLGVRDYVQKNGFPGALIGFSGGVDSALTLAIAIDALGVDKVRTVMMPSPYTAEISWLDTREMAQRVGVSYEEISIVECFHAFKHSLAPQFIGMKEDTTEENIQARIRGTMLMALSNKLGSIVLTTGNKSEMAVGYCTLYGDMAGGFAVIKDVAKTMVYRLCRYRNTVSDIIPERILTRAPSAELRPDQTDQDSLPPYEILDEIMRRFVEDNQSRAEIIAAGLPAEAVERVTRLIKINEYKRRQAPVGVRITKRAFGRDWRYPISSKFQG